MEDEMQMLVGFSDESQSFVNGFEAGIIWAHLESGSAEPIDRGYEAGFPVHTENVEVIRRMAQVKRFAVETKPESIPGWTPMRLVYVGGSKAKPKLSVVRP